MARLMLIGTAAMVALTSDPEDGQTIATCDQHRVYGVIASRGCGWAERYDTLDDAAEYATDHADTGGN